MEKVLFDTNVILDIALKRLPHFEFAVELFSLIDKKKISWHVTATTITDIYYISKKEKGHKIAINFISNLVDIVEIIGIDRDVILKALKSDMIDFEDSIQFTAAEFSELDSLITRNVKDFVNSSIKIYTPADYLKTKK